MNDRGSTCSVEPHIERQRLLARLAGWWRGERSDEAYLANATDHADLERRMRAIERAGPTPVFTTFNH